MNERSRMMKEAKCSTDVVKWVKWCKPNMKNILIYLKFCWWDKTWRAKGPVWPAYNTMRKCELIFFKCAFPGLFLVYFRSFSNKQLINVKTPSSIWCWDSSSRPSKQMTPPITTRLGLPSNVNYGKTTGNNFYLKRPYIIVRFEPTQCLPEVTIQPQID